MVYSEIDKTIKYSDSRNVDSLDISHESPVYYGEIYTKPIKFILGKPNNTYIENNIVYFNIYLVHLDPEKEIFSRIGVYEIETEKYAMTVDENDAIDFSLFSAPILIDDTREILESYREKSKATEKSKAESKAESKTKAESKSKSRSLDSEEKRLLEEALGELDSKSGQKDSKSGEKDSKSGQKEQSRSLLREQTREEAEEEKRIYKSDENTTWIERFMRNNNYGIIDNEGGGDCLFAVIRDALEKIDKKISVQELRQKVADEATEEVFRNYKYRYDMFMDTYRILATELKELVKKNREMKDEIKKLTIKAEQQKLLKQATATAQRYKQAKQEYDVTKEYLEEYSFMKNINTHADFKKVLTICDFWADAWAISTLERVLNVKLIILSHQQFDANDMANVLQCGAINDRVLEERGVFNPSEYILTEYTGSHYKLITYKGRGALKFQELPLDIKELIKNKCLEREAGPFYIIPEFRDYKHGSDAVAKEELKDVGIANAKTEAKTEAEATDEPATDSLKINGLYDSDVVFKFYESSNDKPLPGKGSGETIPAEKVKEYAELAKIKGWRKKLSNFWTEAPFKLEGFTWASVEHFYQANKFKRHQDFYKQFTLESNSELSKDPVLAKAAGSKTGRHGSTTVRHRSITIDPDFLEDSDKIMERALYAKFTQNPEMKIMLLATKKAKLLYYVRASPAIVMDNLMRIRKLLQE